MANLIFPNRWRNKPQYEVMVDQSHWFVQGARLVLPFFRQGNTRPYAPASWTFADGGFLDRDSWGACANISDSIAGLDLGATAAFQIDTWTILCVAKVDPTQYTTLSNTDFTGSSGGAQFRTSNAGKVELIKANAFGMYTSGSISLAAGVPSAIGFSYDSATGAMICFIDGKLDGTGTSSTTFVHSSFVVGQKYSGSSSESVAHKQYLYCPYPRALTHAALADLTAAPWQIFAPLRRRLYSPAIFVIHEALRTEAITLTESTVAGFVKSAERAEGVTLDALQAAIYTTYAADTEPLTLTESSIGGLLYEAALTEGVGLAIVQGAEFGLGFVNPVEVTITYAVAQTNEAALGYDVGQAGEALLSYDVGVAGEFAIPYTVLENEA